MKAQLPNLTAEEIEQNWLRYVSLLGKIGDRSTAAVNMAEALGERLALCPASAKKDFHRACAGGLVDHSLRVLTNALTYSKAFGWKLPKDSLILSCLCHDLGKVGDVDNEYYIAAEEWRAQKLGELYTYNYDMQHMSNPDRSIFLLQHYGVKLTQDEHLAIRLNDGYVVEENKTYCLKEPLLAHVVMTADYVSTMVEKGMFSSELHL